MAQLDSSYNASLDEPDLGAWSIDSTFFVDVVREGDTARVSVHVAVQVDRSTGSYALTVEIGSLVFTQNGCADQSSMWWQFAASVSAAATTLLVILNK